MLLKIRSNSCSANASCSRLIKRITVRLLLILFKFLAAKPGLALFLLLVLLSSSAVLCFTVLRYDLKPLPAYSMKMEPELSNTAKKIQAQQEHQRNLDAFLSLKAKLGHKKTLDQADSLAFRSALEQLNLKNH